MKKLNNILSVIFLFITIFASIYLKDLKVLCFVFYLILINLLKNPYLVFIGLTYGFIGIFLGFLLHFYKTIFWYDTFVHFLSGIYLSLIAIYVLNLFKMWSNNKLFNVIFIVSFVLALSNLWEIVEFIIDIVFKSDMQRRATGVVDTMKDLISALLGTLLFNIVFYKKFNVFGGKYGK